MSLVVSRRKPVQLSGYETLADASSCRTVNNPKVSDEAKESAKERLKDMGQ